MGRGIHLLKMKLHIKAENPDQGGKHLNLVNGIFLSEYNWNFYFKVVNYKHLTGAFPFRS